ncbi:MAG: hypothetical protein HY561_08330, partial [Gemmatimonadetes bacterium]|nr:hypothetical protein [Gemmatimonadota bacterium]
VGVFGTVLSYWETLVGTLLLLGVATELGLTLAGILMVLLTLGTVLQQNAETVAHNLLFAFLVAALLWMSEHNRYSVDGLRRARNRARALREPSSRVDS